MRRGVEKPKPSLLLISVCNSVSGNKFEDDDFSKYSAHLYEVRMLPRNGKTASEEKGVLRQTGGELFRVGGRSMSRERRRSRDRLNNDRSALRHVFSVFFNDPRVYPVADMGVTSFSSLPSSMSSATSNS